MFTQFWSSYGPLERRRALWAYLFLVPTAIGLAIFKFYAIARVMWTSLFDADLLLGTGNFVGLDNFAEMVTDARFSQTLWNSLVYSLGNTFMAVVLGISLALLADRKVRGVTLFRSVAYLPIVVSLTIVSIVFALIYAVEGGLLNGVFRAVGLPPQPFLTSTRQALPAVMAMHIWHGAGYYMVLFLAGLQGIPEVYYEAARIDGATRLAAFRNITLPLLRHVILFVVVFGTVGYINTFAPVYLMTRGGPQGSTTLLSYLIYQQVFVYLRLGYGSAMAVVLVITVLSLVLVELRLFRSGEEI